MSEQESGVFTVPGGSTDALDFRTGARLLPAEGTRNRLTNPQRYKLTRWVEDNLEMFKSSGISSDAAAERATKAVGFEVSKSNILSLAGSGKDCIFQHKWPNNPELGGGENNHTPRKLALVAVVLNEVVRRVDPSMLDTLGIRLMWEELMTGCPVPTIPQVVAESSQEGSC
jgi:hypothetical protein